MNEETAEMTVLVACVPEVKDWTLLIKERAQKKSHAEQSRSARLFCKPCNSSPKITFMYSMSPI